MEIRVLRYFLTVARAGDITGSETFSPAAELFLKRLKEQLGEQPI